MGNMKLTLKIWRQADAKAKGAIPIVLSLIPRNDWKDGKVLRAFPGYGQMAKDAAQSGGAAFVDLNGITADKYDALGEAAVKPFFPNEHTHTNPHEDPHAACHFNPDLGLNLYRYSGAWFHANSCSNRLSFSLEVCNIERPV